MPACRLASAVDVGNPTQDAPMLEKRDLKVDLLALGLLALTVFLAASLLSYDRADPPAKLVYPQHTEPTNVCGPYGALAALAGRVFDAGRHGRAPMVARTGDRLRRIPGRRHPRAVGNEFRQCR